MKFSTENSRVLILLGESMLPLKENLFCFVFNLKKSSVFMTDMISKICIKDCMYDMKWHAQHSTVSAKVRFLY